MINSNIAIARLNNIQIILSDMSIYSGFATRKDEGRYNDLLSKLLLMMQHHLLETVEGAVPQKKVLGYTKLITKMREYEEHKYLPPKFTELLDPLCKLIGLNCGSEKIEDETTQIEEKLRFMSQKSSSYAQSIKRQRVKSKLASCLQNFDTRQIKKSSLLEENHLQLTNHLKQRKPNLNISLGEAGVEVGATYEEQSLSKGNTAKHLIGSQPIILSNKIKGNLRYRAFHALNEVQQNIHKRNTPLRQEMRKKLKTTADEHSCH